MYAKAIMILISFFLLFSKPLFNAHAEDAEGFRFVVMGCMHFGLCAPGDYELAVEKIKQFNPDFVLFLGGMVEAVEGKSVESLWQEFEHITERLQVPVYNIPSDCRLLPLSMSREKLDLMEKCFLVRYKKRYYSFVHKNNLFICLDSRNELSEDKDQFDFLKKSIADTFGYDNVFIAINYCPGITGKSKWHQDIHSLIKGKVKYVFSSHEHFIDQEKVEDVTYITSGCPPCGPERLSRIKPFFFHFLIVNVDKKGVDVRIEPVRPFAIQNLRGLENDIELVGPSSFRRYNLIAAGLSSAERKAILQPSRVVEALKIKPGMNILDIGAGPGLFTFPFAEALNGTGKVFATDIHPESVHYIKKKAEEGKYKNIFPTLVKAEGVDPLYKQYSFDIIFLSEVYDSILYPEDYFQELRPSLKKTGRLYIIHSKNTFDFSEIEFDDFMKTIKVLFSNGEGFPVFQRLTKEVQHFIKNWQGNEVPSEVRMKIVQDFNKVLSDRFLLNDLSDYYASKMYPGRTLLLQTLLAPDDIKLAKWLIVGLDKRGVFDKNKKRITDIDKEGLHQLNRILLTGIFQINKLDLDLITTRRICQTKDSVISIMEAAGFRFAREYDFLPYHHFLEFEKEF